ncbi:PQQ-binding-like beta-propeller repeat protein [bacterium]|nr:PQQ-binding-like beta-propeller repeat protein [bacterium]
MPMRTVAALLTAAVLAGAAERGQWGQRDSRNMVSPERGLPASFDPATGQGVRWTASLGCETYGALVVAGGKVFVGTNNRQPRDPRHQGDRGVLMCFDEKDGAFLWQLVVPKLTSIRYGDWHYVGIASSPVVEDGRAWLATNRGEVVCLDVRGMANGNGGPYTDEGAHMTPPGGDRLEPGPRDADILWLYDMVAELGVRPHNASNGSPLMIGDLLYVGTCNGVEWTHKRPANPDAPSLIVLDKRTGRLVAVDDAGIGPRIFHGQWASPSTAKVGGRQLVFYGGGDGVVYAFEALPHAREGQEPTKLKTVWSFLCDTEGRWIPEGASHRPADADGPSTIIGMPVAHAGRIYVAACGDPWHGKDGGALYCIDATGVGDITQSGRAWVYTDIGWSISTVAVADGLVYAAGYDGRLHCVDARTGKAVWVHDARGMVYGSPLVADGKVYYGTARCDLWVLAAGRQKNVLAHIALGTGMSNTPAAARRTLFIAADGILYAAAAEK